MMDTDEKLLRIYSYTRNQLDDIILDAKRWLVNWQKWVLEFSMGFQWAGGHSLTSYTVSGLLSIMTATRVFFCQNTILVSPFTLASPSRHTHPSPNTPTNCSPVSHHLITSNMMWSGSCMSINGWDSLVSLSSYTTNVCHPVLCFLLYQGLKDCIKTEASYHNSNT